MKSLNESIRSFINEVNEIIQERGIDHVNRDEVQRNWTDYASTIDTTRVQNICSHIFAVPAEQIHIDFAPHDYEESAITINYYSSDEAVNAVNGFLTYSSKYGKFANFGIKGAEVRHASLSDTLNPNAWVDLTEINSAGEVIHKMPDLNNGQIIVTFDINEDMFQ